MPGRLHPPHRRTARAGASGKAINFLTSADRPKWNAIDRLMNPNAPHVHEPRESRPNHRRDGQRNNFGKRRSFNRGNDRARGLSDLGEMACGGAASANTASTTLLAQGCYLCLRYNLLPMSPVWTRHWETSKALKCHLEH